MATPANEVRVEGADEIHRLYTQLKEIGDHDLRKRLTSGIRKATLPAKEAVRASALSQLPKKGGLAQRVADSKLTNRVSQSRTRPGVTIKAASGIDLPAIDKGKVRHKTFGKLPWRTQSVNPGFFSEPMHRLAPAVRASIEHEMRAVARELKN